MFPGVVVRVELFQRAGQPEFLGEREGRKRIVQRRTIQIDGLEVWLGWAFSCHPSFYKNLYGIISRNNRRKE
ncbi:MAG: hypothetical protein ANABAC_1815 [Anaerolineae bacterium]|jgi:hypothetical protein|nr:MAG: hypothetical protein ANABAC_1815 [Anaerolineae bacterium]